MAFKTLATVFRFADRDAAHLDAAIELTRREDGHLHVLALGTDRTQPGAYYAGAEAIAIQASMAEAVEEAKEAEEAARERLERSGINWEITGAVAQVGALAQIVTRRASLTDLIIVPKPYGEGRTVEDVAITEAALFATRTPVLVLPAGLDRAPEPKRICIGWNQSVEALAAIRAALPLLQPAENVNIAIIDPPRHDLDRSDPGGLLAEMLARHGVHCDISVLARTMPKISDVLNRHIEDTGAEMVVMGAYGHSRFRESIFGGATRNMLEDAQVPLFMAH